MAASPDESVLTYSPEAGEVVRVFFGKYRADGKGDFDLWLSGYSGEPVKVDRIGRPPISLSAPSLSALLMAQPFVIREVFGNEEARERGLLARTLAFVASCELLEDDGEAREPDAVAVRAWGGRVRELLDARRKRKEPLRVIADADAASVLRAFHNESIRLCKGPLSAIAGELSRWRENACRVALALHAAENPEGTILTAETAERAVRLTRWAQLSTLRLLASGFEQKAKAQAEKLREWLNAGGGSLTVGALQKRHGMAEDVAASLCHTFPLSFVLEPHADSKGGPRTKVVRLLA